MSAFATWSMAFLLVLVAILSFYYLVDGPVALWVHAHRAFDPAEDLELVTKIPNPVVLVGLVAYFALGLSTAAGRQLARFGQVVLACSFSILITEEIKDLMKWIFGRPSPEIWGHHTISFVADSEYRFHWFQGGDVFNSFPSGHMAATMAVLSVLWACYPALRPIYLAAAGCAAIVLIVSNSHFVGDVIAGGFLGTTIGWITLAVVQSGALQRLAGKVGMRS